MYLVPKWMAPSWKAQIPSLLNSLKPHDWKISITPLEIDVSYIID